MQTQIQIEPAQPDDAAAVLEVHCAAVHQTAAPFYSAEVINSWARLPIERDRIDRVRQRWIENGDRQMIVARQGDRLVGFGFVDKTAELQGLYVHPDYGRQGIGARILAALEQAAFAFGVSVLQVDASINAEAFYSKQGFQVTEHSTHRLASGQEIACIKMRKVLRSN
ncbi:MAG: GNAT family N-acetyltransferase [Leptolyngbyaceae cyanobacterium SL_5_9]|nr:GNAT family N-acetyltransferase [Leptolyngbyaceae cyanobacterium SL_5_9]NJO75038.1 GNAT family N-acetyltransferase [Leptolyngbyaceae cyanobacterium RM1_406_9]